MMTSPRVRRNGARLGALWLAVLLTGGAASGQTAAPSLPPGPLTLEQVLDLAEGRNESLAIARVGLTRAEGERVRARSGLLPQLSASAGYDRALASEFEAVFGSVAGPSCPPFMPDPLASIDARVAEIERAVDCGAAGSGAFDGVGGGFEDLPFGRRNTWRAGLTLSQNLWSGGRNGAQAAVAAAGLEAADLFVTSTRGQLRLDVTTAYYDVALSARLVAIAESTVEQADATLQQVQVGFDAGTQPEFEVLRARVSRDNQRPVVIRQRVNHEIALLRLKQLLDLPASYDLRIADTLEDDALAPPPAFAARVASVETLIRAEPGAVPEIARVLQAALPERTAVGAAEAQVRLSEASVDLAEAQRRPSLTFNSSYGRVAYPSGFFAGFDSRTNWTIGANLQVPLLTGGRQRGDEIVARANLEESRARLQQIQELAGLDTRLAWAELLAAHAAWQATSGTVEQAMRAYQIAEVRYEAGVSTQLELSDARLLLQQAEANRALAGRDVQVARARVALLPELPLGQGGAGGGGAAPPVVPQAPSAATTAPLQQAGSGGALATPGARSWTQTGR